MVVIVAERLSCDPAEPLIKEKKGELRSFPFRQPDMRLFGQRNALIFTSRPRNERSHFLY